MYDSSIVKEHLFAIGQACYDHRDMLWQEDYFELWDAHFVPLYKEIDINEMPTDAANEFYKQMIELTNRNDDMWFQDDWYDFCDAAFRLLLELGNAEGWAHELSERFPYVYETA